LTIQNCYLKQKNDMVTKAQYVNFMLAFTKLAEEHGLNAVSLKVKGQLAQENIIKSVELKLDMFNESTHGTINNFHEFKHKRNLKLLWARMSSAVKQYELDPEEVANIAPNNCPVTGAVLDYGYGLHQTTDNPYFRPGIDHILAVGNGGNRLGDISNIQIVSQHFNTIKNYGTEIDALKWLMFESKKYNG